MLQVDSNVAGYRIDAKLGEGGMGVVYEATQLSLNRKVALKVLPPDLTSDIVFRERFRREGQIQAGIDHPHIVTVHEAGEIDEGLFIAMRLIRGPTLKDLITDPELDDARVFRLLRPIADALDTAHEAGLIHRDVKPQNILTDARGHPYLADFGLTKNSSESGLTRTGQFVGTLDYISPEQIRGAPALPQSDIYALAAVPFGCLTAQPPFTRPSDVALLYAHLSDPAPRVSELRPDLPPALDDAIARSLAKDPADRHQTASDLLLDAERAMGDRAKGRQTTVATRRSRANGALAGSARDTPAGSSGPSATRRGRRSALRWATAGAVLIATATVGVLLGTGSSTPAATSLSNTAMTDAIEIRYPDTWRPVSGDPVRSLGLRNSISLAPADGQPVSLTAGEMPTATGASLVPEALLRTLPQPPGDDDRVVLAGGEALRHVALAPSDSQGRKLTLFSLPASRGVLGAACTYASTASSAAVTECLRIVKALRARNAKARSLGPHAGYAATMKGLTTRLAATRRRERGRLSKARTRPGQARIADAIAVAYARAADEATAAQPGARETRAHRAFVTALRGLRDDYRALSSAARQGDRVRYARARRNVVAGERDVRAALASLEPLGYRLR